VLGVTASTTLSRLWNTLSLLAVVVAVTRMAVEVVLVVF
jgi:hypothetical protein